jgi:hypothetical protein
VTSSSCCCHPLHADASSWSHSQLSAHQCNVNCHRAADTPHLCSMQIVHAAQAQPPLMKYTSKSEGARWHLFAPSLSRQGPHSGVFNAFVLANWQYLIRGVILRNCPCAVNVYAAEGVAAAPPPHWGPLPLYLYPKLNLTSFWTCTAACLVSSTRTHRGDHFLTANTVQPPRPLVSPTADLR